MENYLYKHEMNVYIVLKGTTQIDDFSCLTCFQKFDLITHIQILSDPNFPSTPHYRALNTSGSCRDDSDMTERAWQEGRGFGMGSGLHPNQSQPTTKLVQDVQNGG